MKIVTVMNKNRPDISFLLFISLIKEIGSDVNRHTNNKPK